MAVVLVNVWCRIYQVWFTLNHELRGEGGGVVVASYTWRGKSVWMNWVQGGNGRKKFGNYWSRSFLRILSLLNVTLSSFLKCFLHTALRLCYYLWPQHQTDQCQMSAFITLLMHSLLHFKSRQITPKIWQKANIFIVPLYKKSNRHCPIELQTSPTYQCCMRNIWTGNKKEMDKTLVKTLNFIRKTILI